MKEKKANGIQLLLRAVVTDPDGKVVSDTGQKPARSFLIQFLEFIFAMFDGAWKYATATNGGEDPIGSDGFSVNRQLRIDGQINESWKGIVVGTGTRPRRTRITRWRHSLPKAWERGTSPTASRT